MSEPSVAFPAIGPWADRGWYLVIEFQQSSSDRFEKAVQLAGKNPSFQVLIDEAGQCVYRVLYRAEQLGALPQLLDLVDGWKQTRCYVCGTETAAETLYNWLSCYLQRQRQRLPECRRPLAWASPAQCVGCRFAGISLEPNEWSAWYHLGKLGEDGVFRVDKVRLVERIDAWQAGYAACPFADAGIVRRVVDALPDTLDVRFDKHWRTAFHYYRGMVPAPRSRALYEEYLRRVLTPLLDNGHDRA